MTRIFRDQGTNLDQQMYKWGALGTQIRGVSRNVGLPAKNLVI